MKHSSFKIICLIVWACITVLSSFGDEVSINFETRILEEFNGDSDYTWLVDGSKFATKASDKDSTDYPEIRYVEAYPIAAFGRKPADDKKIQSLGIHGKFDRKGYNWVDLYPTKDGKDANGDDKKMPAEIPIAGRVHSFDMWVWGSNLRYYVEIYLRDHQGVIHTLKLGDIAFTGWKNLRVNVNSSIPQSKRIQPAYAGLKFVKFRIWTTPSEHVDNFYIYFKQLKILTDKFENFYDGNDLADPEFVEEIWKE